MFLIKSFSTDLQTFALDKMGESGFLDHADPGKVLETLSMACTGRTVPRTALVCSLPEKSLTPVAAATFMHEIGHCVHSLLSRTQFQHLSGTRGVVDFVELPSHLFEHYVMDPEALTKYLGDGTGIQGASKKVGGVLFAKILDVRTTCLAIMRRIFGGATSGQHRGGESPIFNTSSS